VAKSCVPKKRHHCVPKNVTTLSRHNSDIHDENSEVLACNPAKSWMRDNEKVAFRVCIPLHMDEM